MAKKPPAIPLVYIRWFDSGITDHCATSEPATMTEMESAGLLLTEDKASVTIAMDRSLTFGNLRCTLCIPKVNIRSMRRFKA